MKGRVKKLMVMIIAAVGVIAMMKICAGTDSVAISAAAEIGSEETTTETESQEPEELQKNGWINVGESRMYYVNGQAIKGKMLVPIKDKKGRTFYYSFDKNGYVIYGKIKYKGHYYFHTKAYTWHSGAAVTGWKTLNGRKYYFSKVNRQAVTGLKKIQGAKYYFDKYGRMVKKTWKTVRGKRYYFGWDGKAKTGFCTIQGKRYYFSKSGALQKSKLIKVGSKRYYIGKHGYVTTGLKKINGSYYYFGTNGAALKNTWKTINGSRYYFTSSGKACTGSKTINKKLYVFASNGKRIQKKGLVTVDGKTYYLNSKGTAQTGYKKIDGSYYYFGSDGVMYKKKWAYVNGYKFYFCSNGKRATDVDDVLGKQDSYEIIVNKYSQTVTVYAKDGKNGYIIPVKAFICSPGNATPLGTFHTQSHYRWHELMGPCWGQWCTGIYEGYLFHSVYYNDVNNNNALSVNAYNKLGTTCSHGCVRLTAGDAKWLYDNCKVGTKVTIINKKDADPFPKPTAYKLSSGHTWDPTDPNMKWKCEKYGCH